jgi:glucose/arabinose dehydrogenase
VTPTRASEPQGGRIVAQPLATDLDHPAAFDVAADGSIFYGERLTGQIRRLVPADGSDTAVTTVPSVVGELTNEQGLVGVALEPGFDGSGWLYAYATRTTTDGVRNHLLRTRIRTDGSAGPFRLVLDVMAAAERHNGGGLEFGLDGALFLVTGEATVPSAAQDPDVLAGKVLRLRADGGVPSDNPDPGSRIFASGIRNSFGLDVDPVSGALWETENGPECNDEINRVPPASNLGWGASASCGRGIRSTNVDGPSPVLPVISYEVTIAPTGIAFCDGCELGTAREGRVFFGAFNTGDIHELTLATDRRRVLRDRVVFHHRNLVLSIERAPDGRLYFSDGRAIYRLRLAG